MSLEQNEKYMRLAIEEANKSAEPLKCGVVVVKDNKVIAKAYNSQRTSNNASAHAEIKAIGLAGQTVGSKYLDDCEIYCTCEPCVMCLSAITFAKIKKLYFGTTLSDVSAADKCINISIDDFLAKAPHKFEVVKNFLEEECRKIL